MEADNELDDTTELLVQLDMGDEIDATVTTAAIDDAGAVASPELAIGFGAGEVLKDRMKMVIFYF